MSRPFPHLLVSVRSRAEAAEALAGGADLIDVKEPSRGALGGSDPATIGEILQSVRATASHVPVSAALGELADLRRLRFDSPSPFPGPVDYVKVGLAGCAGDPSWRDAFYDLQDRFDDEARSPHAYGPRWIAVAYVDREAANAPPLAEILRHAIDANCYGLLLDTYSKEAGRLTDYLSSSELADWIARAHERELFVACAGRLTLEQLPAVVAADPDIVAIRSAGCRGSDRLAAIDAGAVRSFRDRLGQLAAAGIA